MRKFIIDTDAGADDAAALMLAAACPDIELLGVTTVAGNVPLEQATKNALATLEACGSTAPVYMGAAKPLVRELHTAVGVHGADGMGDAGLVHPMTAPQSENAVDFIIKTVAKYPGEVEILAIGPVTNLAIVAALSPDAMKNIKRVWSMGTSGFGPGNATPVAEFNVYVDAEAYCALLTSGVPVTVVGLDCCTGEAAFTAADFDRLAAGGKASRFIYDCTSLLRVNNIVAGGDNSVYLADPVAAGVAFFDGTAKEYADCCLYCCTKEDAAYGQVVIYEKGQSYSGGVSYDKCSAAVVKKVDAEFFNKKFFDSLDSLDRLLSETGRPYTVY